MKKLVSKFLYSIESVCQCLHNPSVLKLLRALLKGNSGVYAFVCLTTNKCYVGSAKSLLAGFNQHLGGLRSNVLLQRAILKYGISNFAFVILEFCPPEQLIEREQFYIDELKPEFNILTLAGSTLGYKHSPDVLDKMSGENHPLYGKPRNAETRTRISEGRSLSRARDTCKN
jgi:group I intron endonuclease